MSRPRPFLPALVAAALVSALAAPLAMANPATTAPQGRFAFKSYDSALGLSNTAIWSIGEDSDGFLWVGTEGGLFRYDGSSFRAFRTDDGLPSEWIRTVYQAPSGTLWVGTLRGLAYRQGDGFVALGAEQGVPALEIYAALQDARGRLWVGTPHGLFRESQPKRFEPVPGWSPDAPARALWMDGDHVLVASESQLLRVPLEGTAVEPLASVDERIDGLARDSAGRLWLRSRNRLWMRPSDAAPLQDLSARAGAPVSFDAQVFVDGSGAVWMPSSEGVLHIQGEEWEHLGQSHGLPILWVNRVFIDREGSLWLGGSGLYRKLGGGVWTQLTHKDGVPGGVVRSLARDRKGRLWAGTPRGLYRVTPEGWTLVEETRGQVVLALEEAPDGALWIGEGGKVPLLHRWSVDSGEWTHLPQAHSTITAIHVDATGAAWVATRREGLQRFSRDGAGYRAEHVVLPGGAADERIQSIAPGAEGRLWIGAAEGLALYEAGAWRRFGTADGLEHKHVMAVLERPGGELWVSYLESHGLTRFRYGAGKLERIGTWTTADGLASNQVSFLREDLQGRLWIGSSQGVHLLDKGVLDHFGIADGLPGDDCGGNTLLAEANGDVWIGTSNGLGYFHADAYRGLPPPPQVHLLSVRIGDRAFYPPLPQGRRVAHGDATVELRFSGLTFAHEAAVRHQVRLVGLEDGWRDTDVRQARHAALPAGHYRFEARAGFGAGQWGPVAAWEFDVLPAWWQHWLFRLLVAVVALAAVALAVRFRLAAAHRKNAELQELVDARTRQLELNAALLRETQLTVTELEHATASISAASARQTSGASRQSEAISQTSVAMAHINAIAEHSSAKAREVAESLQRTEEVSKRGQGSVEQAIEGMGQLRERIGSIATTIAELSGNVQRVGEINQSVKEIAELSNLLALNASIEAARAGEAGVGFAVVAREMKALADQSRRASDQVSRTLAAIMTSARATVAATEEGAKSAEEKAQVAEQGRIAIKQLAEVMARSAREAQAMAQEGREQAMGIDQINAAMHRINEATADALQGTRETEQAAKGLEELARKLAKTVDQYRL